MPTGSAAHVAPDDVAAARVAAPALPRPCAAPVPRVVDINALRALAPLPRAPVPRPSTPPAPHTEAPLEPQAQRAAREEQIPRARALRDDPGRSVHAPPLSVTSHHDLQGVVAAITAAAVAGGLADPLPRGVSAFECVHHDGRYTPRRGHHLGREAARSGEHRRPPAPSTGGPRWSTERKRYPARPRPGQPHATTRIHDDRAPGVTFRH